MSDQPNYLGCAEVVEAVAEGDADLDFGGLVVWLLCGDALGAAFEAARPGSDPFSGLVAIPPLQQQQSIVQSAPQVSMATTQGGICPKKART
jgi:hypothetical protein